MFFTYLFEIPNGLLMYLTERLKRVKGALDSNPTVQNVPCARLPTAARKLFCRATHFVDLISLHPSGRVVTVIPE
jgi:hypothetical protein